MALSNAMSLRRCQLLALGSHWDTMTVAYLQLCRCGNACDLDPNLKGLSPGGWILDGGHSVTAEVKEVADSVMGGDEALVPGRLT